MRLVKAICLFFTLLLATFACAVDSFDYHCANIALLQDKRVQTEVGITSKQRDQMNKYAQAHQTKLEAYQKKLAGKQPDMTVLTSYVDDLKSKVIALMTPAQIKRLRELNLQAAGLIGMLDEVVATKVGMSKAQFTKYREAYVNGKNSAESLVRRAMLPIDLKYQKLAAPYKGKEREHQKELDKLKQDFLAEAKAAQTKMQPSVEAITNQTEKKMTGSLTPKQKAAWIALQGKKFVPPKTK